MSSSDSNSKGFMYNSRTKLLALTSMIMAASVNNSDAGRYTYQNLEYGPPVVEINLGALKALRMSGMQNEFAKNRIQAQPIMDMPERYNPNIAPIRPVIAEPVRITDNELELPPRPGMAPRPAPTRMAKELTMQPILTGDPGTVASKPSTAPVPTRPSRFAKPGSIPPPPVAPALPQDVALVDPILAMPQPEEDVLERVPPIKNKRGNEKYYKRKKPKPSKPVMTAKPAPKPSAPKPSVKVSAPVVPVKTVEVKKPTLPTPPLPKPKETKPLIESKVVAAPVIESKVTLPPVPKPETTPIPTGDVGKPVELPKLPKIPAYGEPETPAIAKKEVTVKVEAPVIKAPVIEPPVMVKPVEPLPKIEPPKLEPENDIRLKLAQLPDIPGTSGQPIVEPKAVKSESQFIDNDIMPGVTKIDLDADSTKTIELPPVPEIETKVPLPETTRPVIPDFEEELTLPELGQEPRFTSNQPSSGNLSTDSGDYIVRFNKGEIEYPLNQQNMLDNVAQRLKDNPDKIANLHAYASGTEDQSSQARRTSLRRALSIRNYLLGKDIDPSRVTPRVYGNESLASTPDKVEIHIE